jgi:hypothetical protein
MNYKSCWIPAVAVLLLAPLSALAADSPEEKVGTQTRSLLEVQRSGQAASDTERPMSGEVARRTHQRYVESFSQPIPESLAEEEKEFVKDGD